MNNYERYEIVQMYKEAADKNKQIKILAQLNCCSEKDILNILVEEGAISGDKPKTLTGQVKDADKRRSERGKWTEERLAELQKLIDDGLTYEEIGEKMGEAPNAIGTAVYNYKLRGRDGKRTKVIYDVPKTEEPIKVEQRKEAPAEIDELKRKIIHMQNELDDISMAAKVVKDLVMLPCMVSAEECESFEEMVTELLYRAGEMLGEIIKRAEGEEK